MDRSPGHPAAEKIGPGRSEADGVFGFPGPVQDPVPAASGTFPHVVKGFQAGEREVVSRIDGTAAVKQIPVVCFTAVSLLGRKDRNQSRSSPLLSITFLYQKKESFLLLEKSPVPSSWRST